MKYILTIFIFLFICIGLSAQTPSNSTSGKMTKQDSINAFVKKRDAAIDSMNTKTSLKEFSAWLDENVSAKAFRETPYSGLYNAFIQAKLEEWVRKNKIVIPN